MSDYPAAIPQYLRRSPLSPAVSGAAASSDFADDARADYLAAEREPEAPAADLDRGLSAALLLIARFGTEARKTFPDLTVEVFLMEKSDRVKGTYAPQWGVRASGQPLGAAKPSTQAATPKQALKQLVALVAAARTATAQAREAGARERRPEPAKCHECGYSPGYNTESCGTCYAWEKNRQHQLAA